MKKLALPILASIAALSSPVALAEFEYSANVTLVSNYVFRGYSFSDDEMATQGGFDVEHESGFSAGVWGTSSVDPNGEVDFYASYAFDLSDQISMDVGVVRYHYPGGNGTDSSGTTEYHIGLGWEDLSFTWHKDVHADTDYFEANYSIGINDNMAIDLHLGRVNYDDAASTDATDYGATFTYNFNDNYSVFLSYTDVNDDAADSQFFGGISASF